MHRVHDILARSSLYRGLDAASLVRLSSLSRVVRASAGQTVFRAGEPCPGVYVVGSGVAQLVREAPSGKRQVLRFIEEGQGFAEAAVIGGFPTPVACLAVEDLECALIPADDFRALIHADHDFCIRIMQSMAARVHTLVSLLEDLALRDAVSRLARYIAEHVDGPERPVVSLAMTKSDLALHLNLSRETLSRTLRRMKDIGAIDLTEEGLRLVNPGLVSRIARDGLTSEILEEISA